MERPTCEDLLKTFIYNKDDGLLYRKKNPGRAVGTECYRTSSDGTKVPSTKTVWYKGKVYGIHRVIWCMVHGYFPENMIDHINRNPFDNMISNLREVSSTCNVRNSSVLSKSRTGVKGVVPSGKRSFKVSITVHGKPSCIFHTKDFYEAVAVRFAAEQCLDWHDCDVSSSAGKVLKEKIEKNKREGKDWSRYVVFDRYDYY